ncbi:MAG TPA: hydrogenase maturation protease [Jiangellaceae bacterium]
MKTVVIGIGNEYRHDDAVGPEVVKRLTDLDLTDVSLAVANGEPAHLIDLWAEAEVAVLVDAVRNDPASPGRIHELLIDVPASANGAASSHGLGLGDAVELAMSLGRMPRRLVVFAVEGADFTSGLGLSPNVSVAVEQVADLVVHEVRAAQS